MTLSEIYARYHPRVRNLCWKYVGRDSEDVQQEVWLRLITRLKRYDETRPFLPWFHVVTRGLVLDFLRRQRPPLEELPEWMPDDRPGLLETLSAREDCRELLALIEAMPSHYAAALRGFLDGHKYREVAKAQGVPTSVIRRRIYQARKWLKEVRA